MSKRERSVAQNDHKMNHAMEPPLKKIKIGDDKPLSKAFQALTSIDWEAYKAECVWSEIFALNEEEFIIVVLKTNPEIIIFNMRTNMIKHAVYSYPREDRLLCLIPDARMIAFDKKGQRVYLFCPLRPNMMSVIDLKKSECKLVRYKLHLNGVDGPSIDRDHVVSKAFVVKGKLHLIVLHKCNERWNHLIFDETDCIFYSQPGSPKESPGGEGVKCTRLVYSYMPNKQCLFVTRSLRNVSWFYSLTDYKWDKLPMGVASDGAEFMLSKDERYLISIKGSPVIFVSDIQKHELRVHRIGFNSSYVSCCALMDDYKSKVISSGYIRESLKAVGVDNDDLLSLIKSYFSVEFIYLVFRSMIAEFGSNHAKLDLNHVIQNSEIFQSLKR